MPKTTGFVFCGLLLLIVACSPSATLTDTSPTQEPSPSAVLKVTLGTTAVSTHTSVPAAAVTGTATATPAREPTPTLTLRPSSTAAAPALTFTPTPASPSNPFRPIAAIDDVLPGTVSRLYAAPDGALWLMTDQAVARLVDDAWTLVLPNIPGELVGIDGLGRVWVMSDDTSEISAWDGSTWTPFTATEGWMPLADAWFRYVRAEQNDGLGRFWVATSQDVRVFDGVRWTVFTPTEMGLGESSAEDLMPDLGITVLDSGEAWVHDCLWGGPGPMGGRGVRWFDGQTWHSADAPISTGCATVIRQDSAGRIWLGVGPDLWRYDPAAGEWVTFRPTETPPFGAARYGVVRDVVPDSSTGAWVTFLLCGGASCDTDVIYHLHGGIWAQLTDQPGYGGQQKLVLDASGDPWLFWQGDIYRVTDDVPELVGEMAPDIASVTADAAGQIWFVAPDQGRDTLWTLSP